MKYIIFYLSLSLLLFASNPSIYSSLGDKIYNDVDNIMKLKEVAHFSKYEEDLVSYRLNVLKLKEDGFALDKKSSSLSKEMYLNSLRVLEKRYTLYTKEVDRVLKIAMQDGDSHTFNTLIATNLVDLEENRAEVLNFTKKHEGEVIITPSINKIIEVDEREKLKAIDLKQNIEKERVQRIRESSKRKEALLEKELQEESEKKKLEIRNKQEEALSL